MKFLMCQKENLRFGAGIILTKMVRIKKEKEEKRVNGKHNDIATTFYVINDKLIFLYGLPLPFLGGRARR